MWRSRDPGAYRGGVGISRDGGQTWSPAKGLPPAAVTHVLIDAKSPTASRTIYACLFGRGVYKSTDDGATWVMKNDGLAGPQPFAWRITASPTGRLYLVVARRSENGQVGDAGDGALYVSDDGAEHWTRVALPSDSPCASAQ